MRQLLQAPHRAELAEQFAESRTLEATIRENVKGVVYGV